MDHDIERIAFVPGPRLSADAQANWAPRVKQPSTVYMRQLDVPFEVETTSGTMSGSPADYVAHDPASGHFWPVDAAYVAMHYEAAEPVEA